MSMSALTYFYDSYEDFSSHSHTNGQAQPFTSCQKLRGAVTDRRSSNMTAIQTIVCLAICAPKSSVPSSPGGRISKQWCKGRGPSQAEYFSFLTATLILWQSLPITQLEDSHKISEIPPCAYLTNICSLLEFAAKPSSPLALTVSTASHIVSLPPLLPLQFMIPSANRWVFLKIQS